MAKKIFALIAVFFLLSCAHVVRNPVKFDQQVYIDNYDKMYEAAIKKGTEMYYTIDHQDKEYGLIKMSRKSWVSTYTITVDFDEDSFTVKGDIDTDIFNPLIGEDAKEIEEAIMEAVKY
ncbi:MAG: hypothetical protein JW976_00060 [Syntrophaceae bacterium]|nr:hypothetical protein [Syntrophaceae bacterium]